MPAENANMTQISNLSHRSTFDTVQNDDDRAENGFSVAISKAYTTETRPVIIVTCISDVGTDDFGEFVPSLVIEPELFRSKSTSAESDFRDHRESLKTFLTQLESERVSKMISHAAATTFGSNRG